MNMTAEREFNYSLPQGSKQGCRSSKTNAPPKFLNENFRLDIKEKKVTSNLGFWSYNLGFIQKGKMKQEFFNRKIHL